MIGGLVVSAEPADRIVRLVGAKVAVAVGFAIVAAGLLIGSRTSVGSSGVFVAGWMALVGLGMSLALATSMSAALSELSPDRSGVGSAALQAINKLGGPLGIAVLGSVLSTAYLTRLALSGLPPAAATAAQQSVFGAVAVAHQLHSPALLTSAHSAFVHGMELALVVSGAIALVGVALTVAFLPRSHVSKEVADLTVEKLPRLSPSHDRSAIALDERNEAATRPRSNSTRSGSSVRRAITPPRNRSSRFPNAGPGSVSQAGSREPIHELVALVHEGRGVGRADRDDLTTMEAPGRKDS